MKISSLIWSWVLFRAALYSRNKLEVLRLINSKYSSCLISLSCFSPSLSTWYLSSCPCCPRVFQCNSFLMYFISYHILGSSNPSSGISFTLNKSLVFLWPSKLYKIELLLPPSSHYLQLSPHCLSSHISNTHLTQGLCSCYTPSMECFFPRCAQLIY